VCRYRDRRARARAPTVHAGWSGFPDVAAAVSTAGNGELKAGFDEGAGPCGTLMEVMRAGRTDMNVPASTPSGGVRGGDIRAQVRGAQAGNRNNQGQGKG